MSRVQRLFVAALTAATALMGFTVSTAIAAPLYDDNGPAVTVYNTPGAQKANGRLWSTSCDKYSSNTVRCTTNLWGTVVVLENGKYLNRTGWHFNNLTYLPSVRSAWRGNPLGNSGEFNSAGRRWKTECDTAATGRGACRSYTWAKYVSGTGGKITQLEGWVFNNQVLFSTGPVKPVTEIPAHVLDRALLTATGFGPLQIDMTTAEYMKLGYIVEEGCYGGEPSQALVNRGLSRIHDYGVWAGEPGIRTAKGAEVGMTWGEVRRLYGSAFEPVIERDERDRTGTNYYGLVRDGDHGLMFAIEEWGVAPRDSDRVSDIRAMTYPFDIFGLGEC